MPKFSTIDTTKVPAPPRPTVAKAGPTPEMIEYDGYVSQVTPDHAVKLTFTPTEFRELGPNARRSVSIRVGRANTRVHNARLAENPDAVKPVLKTIQNPDSEYEFFIRQMPNGEAASEE